MTLVVSNMCETQTLRHIMEMYLVETLTHHKHNDEKMMTPQWEGESLSKHTKRVRLTHRPVLPTSLVVKDPMCSGI